MVPHSIFHVHNFIEVRYPSEAVGSLSGAGARDIIRLSCSNRNNMVGG